MPKRRILVVDDETELVKAIQIRLEQADYEVLVAYDGMEALNKARKEKPDLIILDLLLPRMDGYRICAMLKHDVRYMKIPIIMLTARAGKTDEKLGYECGANTFINKPFQHEAVLAKIKELLKE